MKNCKKYLFLALSIFSFNIYAQAIDPSILSQLSPEQIEMAKDSYASKNSTDKSVEELPVSAESLVTKQSTKIAPLCILVSLILTTASSPPAV